MIGAVKVPVLERVIDWLRRKLRDIQGQVARKESSTWTLEH